MNRNVLVTGGAGYIGSHTCKMLKKKGFTPIAYDNLSAGHRYAVQWGPLIIADLHDTIAMEAVIKQYRPCAVMHFAACAIVQESMSDPEKYYLNNVTGTLHLLAAMRNTGMNKIIFSSSCATYGAPQKMPITETMAQKPINPYGRSKLMVEHILKDYEKTYGIKHALLRYFNAAGADGEGHIGEDHSPETHIIPLMLRAAMRNMPITIYGSCVRDYIHVEDLADAHIKALEFLLSSNQSLEANLGTGNGHTILELLGAVEKVCKTKIRTIHENLREGDPLTLVASYKKAKKILGWKPDRSSLENILNTACQWHKNHE